MLANYFSLEGRIWIHVLEGARITAVLEVLFSFPGIAAAEQSLRTVWFFLYLLQHHYSPSGPDGPRPSDGSAAQPPGSAECNDCMQTPGGVC